MNGMEVAVKFPKMKVSLNQRDLNALGQFGVLPKGVDLIVMDQLKCAVTSDDDSRSSGGAEGVEGDKVVSLVCGGGGYD